MPIKKVALVHDWLVGYRGGERVLEAIAELFPSAEIFTLFYAPGKVSASIERHPIHASFLNSLPFSKKYYRYLLPLFPMAIERFDLTEYDLVISSSHCVAKGVIVSPDALHISYCHTPMRYAWDCYRDYFGGGFKESIYLPFIHYLRLWDAASSPRVDHYIANSEWVKKRIQKYYRREASVINPFVDLEKFQPGAGDLGDYYLAVSAFAPYKRLDLAIDACERLNRTLLIVGEGQQLRSLKARAKGNVRFLGRVEAEELKDIYLGARALLFPGQEDFGIAPLESLACGRPVIAYQRGGVTETVIGGETGVLFPDQTVESLCDAILSFEKIEKQFSGRRCREQAERFSKTNFLERFKSTVESLWNEKHSVGKALFPLENTTTLLKPSNKYLD